MAESIVGAVVNFVGEKLLECTAKPIKRQYNYLRYFNSHIEKLREEAGKLEDSRDGLQMRVDIAKDNAEEILPEFNTWLEDVNEIQVKMTGIESEITNMQRGCFAVKCRLSLSKEAKNTTQAMKALQDRCRNFSVISFPLPPGARALVPLGPKYDFQSRKDIEEDIVKALREFNMVGICGRGGVGKTTMAKRIMRRVKEEGLFDETAMVVVSQKIEMLKIQNEIGEQLGLELKEKDSQSRSHKLHTRSIGGKRILIVLDDVWEYLELTELGIPCEEGFIKWAILLTSRDRDVFHQMYVQKVCEIHTLSENEAWPFFKEKVGNCVDDQHLLSIAQEVARQCKGLPVALVNVAMALKGKKNILIWEDALQRLVSSNPKDMPHVLDDVYKPLKQSYDFLESSHAKSIFLLCCLFPEDGNIPIEDLTVYAMGLSMFETIRSLEQVRKRTYSLVDMLKSRCLLLEGCNKHLVKMHDVVRDVSIFIASQERRINCSDCTWISPFLGEGIELSMRSSFPNLRLLLIDESMQVNDNLFEGMRELNVLSMTNHSLRSLPYTTQLLENLLTLVLHSCKSLETVSIVGQLKNLEILTCVHCDSIEELPVEIGGLSRLRLLDLSYCWKLKTIAPGIISRLIGLEELKMVQSFDKWEAENNEGKERKNAGLRELEFLSNLTCLEIEVKDYILATEQISLSRKIVKFDVTVGDCRCKSDRGSKNKMDLHLPREITLGNWILKFLRDSNCMSLEAEVCNLEFGRFLQNVRWMTLKGCLTVKKLLNISTLSIDDGRSGDTTATAIVSSLEYLKLDKLINLEEIIVLEKLSALKHLWKSSYQNVMIFSNLSFIEIKECHSLRNLNSLAMANCLLQLERLEIWDCEMMKQVFLWNEEEENKKEIGQERRHVTEFPKLKKLRLNVLPILMTFYKGVECIEFPVLTEIEIGGCPQMKSLVSSTTSSGNNQSAASLFSNLSSIYIDGCYSLRNLNSLAMANDCLFQLQMLQISDCKMMEQVFLWNEEEENKKEIGQERRHITEFPKLKKLRLHHLPNLANFYKGIERIKFTLLAEIEIIGCPKLKSFVSSPTFSSGYGNNQNNSGGIDDDHDNYVSLHLFCDSEKVAFGSSMTVKTCGYKSSSSNAIFCCYQITSDFHIGIGKLWINSGNIRSLFSFSIARNLLHLKELAIHDCPEMVKVIEDEEDSHVHGLEITYLFPMLQHLDLHNLPKLKIFCKWRCAFELPSLKDVTIGDCPEMERFTLGSLATPKLETISFGVKIEETFYKWEAKLKGIETQLEGIKTFDKALGACDEFSIRHTTNLLISEDSVLGSEQISIPSNIGKYEIAISDPRDFISSLVGFEEKMHLHLPREITLGNWIHQCLKSVDYVLLEGEGSNNLDLGKARNMRSLIFRDCSMVKKLVNIVLLTDEGRYGANTVFPLLEYLELYNLHNLEEICGIDGPIPEEGFRSNSFKNLKKLNLRNLPALKHLCSLFNVASIDICRCGSLCNLSLLTMANDRLLQLERLRILDCGMMEHIFLWNEKEENEKDIGQESRHIIAFPKLKMLSLHSLPNLTTFCKGIERIEFPMLTEIEIIGCPKLESLASTSSTGNNRSVVLLSSNISSITIRECHGLHDLFSLAMANDCLSQLERLRILDCKMMEQIFLWNEEEENKKDIGQENHHITAFPKLKSLALINLPKLVTFCEGIETIEFHLLTQMFIEDCPNLKILVSTTSSIESGNSQDSLEGV